LFSTNRYIIKRSEFKYVGISVSGEEIKEKVIVRKILNRLKKKINSEFKVSKLCVKVLPFNFINSQKELNDYYKKSDYRYDVIMIFNTESGHYDKIEKLRIKNIWSIFLRLGTEVKRKIHFFEIDYNLDLAIQKGTKDWNYTILNDGNDKNKYFANIFDLILFYTSMHLSYMYEFKQAYELLVPICDPEKSIATPLVINGKRKFKLSPVALSYGRKNNMFIDLSFKESIRHSDNNDWDSSYQVLKVLDDQIPNHKYGHVQKIRLARCAYESGNLDQAISYTNQASQIKPNDPSNYLNYAFFGILNNDTKQLAENYNKLYNKRHQTNFLWSDIIDFLLRENEKEKSNLYNFAIGFLYKVFVETGDSIEYFDLYFKNDLNPPAEILRLYDKINKVKQIKEKTTSTKSRSKNRKKKKGKRRK